MAWINDDWGDTLPEERYDDQEHQREVETAAREVRRLLDDEGIGTAESYREAENQLDDVVESKSGIPKEELDDETFRKAIFFRDLRRGDLSFDIQWVDGDYETAEKSFLTINKAGRSLTDWETILIENRNSSFARTVMSLANIHTANYYWPTEDSSENEIEQLLENIDLIHDTLFQPDLSKPIDTLDQPLMVFPSRNRRPYYIAEFLTVVAGERGKKSETREMMTETRYETSEEIIESGKQLSENALEALSHIAGSTSNSLALPPALYFYNHSGRAVRSLLYGMLYWLTSGGSKDTLARKRVFSAFRGPFEELFVNNKRDVVSSLADKRGSGPRVTEQTADYFQSMIGLIIESSGNINSENFDNQYKAEVKRITGRKPESVEPSPVESRSFTNAQRSERNMMELFSSRKKCGVCGGVLDLQGPVQHDHIKKHSEGGETSVENQRPVHPFCNHQRDQIEEIKSNHSLTSLPSFALDSGGSESQLSFFDDPEFLS
ncbi:5-methylcytosine-specific restriction endonuclease McrA [Salinibacter ruber]|uniref:5-methylcytosine-specific restriction endonuclease McrA n=2 Tax=Salinibacter ruber TaxID=146919 RepID=A0A9X2V8G3_9BACT|nr:5-methylcytosine-specific restriction endonuclease McrA [Salinibacter ruber]MCS4123053.1 5-methylcytosine-specific restriction endonuclease McrA [Salinibacter ruber]